MIEIKNLDKTYHLKNTDVHAIDNVSLSINDGEVYGIIVILVQVNHLL